MNEGKFFTNGASVEEVTDTLADVGTVLLNAEKTLSDGFQWPMDILKLLESQDEIAEVVKDAPIFLEEFKTLNPETAVQAVQDARDRVVSGNGGEELPKVTGFFFKFLGESASSYAFALNTYNEAKDRVDGWKGLFSVGDPVVS